MVREESGSAVAGQGRVVCRLRIAGRAAEHDHVRVEHVAPKVALPLAAFDAARIDVAVVAPAWSEALEEIDPAPMAGFFPGSANWTCQSGPA